MPAPKPKSQHKKIITVSCSQKQKQQIDRLIAKRNPVSRSKYILGVLFEAIALSETDCGEKPPKHSSTVTFQISCTPKQYQAIVSFGDPEGYAERNRVPHFKRSRWIVHQLLKGRET